MLAVAQARSGRPPRASRSVLRATSWLRPMARVLTLSWNAPAAAEITMRRDVAAGRIRTYLPARRCTAPKRTLTLTVAPASLGGTENRLPPKDVHGTR